MSADTSTNCYTSSIYYRTLPSSMPAIADNVTVTWFGSQFTHLHPLLQALHRDGGILIGRVQLKLGKGVAGWIGRRLAQRMGISEQLLVAGHCDFELELAHHEQGMRWRRAFVLDSLSLIKERIIVESQFTPSGGFQTGYWIEQHGASCLHLAVELDQQGGWQWRLLRVFLFRIPVPVFLFPRLVAKKTIVDGSYLFEVAFSYPILGLMFSYSGCLQRVK